jgi:ATP-dependent Clp protease ATP-binding subunit ClpC
MGEGVSTKIEDMVRSEVKKAFNPEFLNRLDEVILFTSLTDDDLIKIIDLLVNLVNVNLVAKQVKIRLAPDAAKYILDKTCGDRSYGARPLRRALQKYIEDPLSEALIQGSLPRPSELEVYLGDTGIYYRQIFAEGEAPGTDAPTAETPVTAGSAPTEVPRGTLLYTFEP